MKKIYLLALVFMFVVSVSSVCAADNNTTDTSVEINNSGVVDMHTYNFKSIQDDIDSGVQKIDLTGDYLRDNRDKDIVVKGNVTIDGHGHKIDAQDKGGIFKLDPKSNLTLINLTLMNGLSNMGSAIDVKDSTINVYNVKFVGNVATLNGGAIYLHVNSKGNLNNVEFESNAAKTAGGSIYSNQNATLNVNNTVFTKNYAPERGGAIYAYENHMSLSNVTMCDNEARRGAGIYAIGDFILNINNSEFINNHAVDEAGAIGLYRNCGCVMNNVTLKGNEAICGAGIYAESNSILNASDAKFISNKKSGAWEAKSKGGAIHLGDNSKGLMSNVFFCDNFATTGAAIYSDANSVLNVSDAKFSNNVNSIIDGTWVLHKCSGTVYLGSKSEGYFNNVSFLKNTASFGNGIYADKSKLIVLNSDFSNNTIDGPSRYYYKDGFSGSVCLCANSDGFFENVTFSDNNANRGAAIFVDDSNIVVFNADFGNNVAFDDYNLPVGKGGAIYLGHNSKGSLNNATFYNNEALYGACVCVEGNSLFNVSDVKFTNNSATVTNDPFHQTGLGGVMYVSGNSEVIMNNSYSCNNKARHGGVVYISANSILNITKSQFKNNAAVAIDDSRHSSGNGGVIYICGESKVNLFNSSISQNKAVHGAGIYNREKSILNARNSEFSDNLATFDTGDLKIVSCCPREVKVNNIEDNKLGDGGAIYISDESYTLLNNVSVYNNHASSGAGVYMSKKAIMRATKSEFKCNFADNDGGAVYANGECMCFIDNSSVNFNKAASGPEGYIDNRSSLKIDNCMREGNGSIDGNNLNLSNGSKCYLDGKYF